MTSTRLREDEQSEDSSDRQGKVNKLWNGLIWTVLWCCMEHSGEDVWNASCDHWCTMVSGETSQLNRSDQFLFYCFKLCESAQRVQADWWSAIKLDTIYGSRQTTSKEKWCFYVDDKDEDWPDLIMFEKWLSKMAFVHEVFSAFKGEQKEADRSSTNWDKRFSKTSNFSASSNVKEEKQMQSNQCPLADGTHKLWNCPLFRKMSVNDR